MIPEWCEQCHEDEPLYVVEPEDGADELMVCERCVKAYENAGWISSTIEEG